MKCAKCGENIAKGEECEFHGQTLCEDCYIDALTPAKACDPWAVYSAKSFSKAEGSHVELTEIQSQILQLLQETGGAETEFITERLQIKKSELERQIATLRHMEKVRGELREGKKFLRLW
jgi:uncharacterized protein YecA (UPF0149 family)